MLLRAFVDGQGDGDSGAKVAIDGVELRCLSAQSNLGGAAVTVTAIPATIQKSRRVAATMFR